MENLYDYVFHYNHFKKIWSAIPRESYNEYWSNEKAENVISSKKIETLIELIIKGKKFINSIK